MKSETPKSSGTPALRGLVADAAQWAHAHREALLPHAQHDAGAHALRVLDELEARLDVMRSCVDASAGVPSELAQREEALGVLAQRLLSAEERTIAMQAELDRAREIAAIAQMSVLGGRNVCRTDETFLVQRKERLEKYKSILTSQSRKVLAAKNALQKRHEECESILAQRSKVLKEAAEVAQQRRLVNAKAARSTASILVFFTFATIGLIGFLAWAVAGQVAPAFFATRVVLAAEARGEEPSTETLTTWTATAEKMVEDPELMALAAERFAARGMNDLATPTAVAARFRPGGDLTYMTDQAGRLTVELRGQGAELTSRQLETFALAAVALANARRDASGDGLPTIISEPVKAGSEPIKDSRLLYAATLSGPGMIIAGLLGFALFKVLQRGKKSFETHMAVVEATA